MHMEELIMQRIRSSPQSWSSRSDISGLPSFSGWLSPPDAFAGGSPGPMRSADAAPVHLASGNSSPGLMHTSPGNGDPPNSDPQHGDSGPPGDGDGCDGGPGGPPPPGPGPSGKVEKRRCHHCRFSPYADKP